MVLQTVATAGGERFREWVARASTADPVAVVPPWPGGPEPTPQGEADAARGGPPAGLSAARPGTSERVEFALEHMRAVAQVTGNVARVELTQFYRNPTSDRLEAVYAFPLPPNAAVTDMLFRIGKRVVLSEVKRKEEARETYERAKEEGKTAALTEQERPNLFTQSVANIPPGETVAVVLRYVHEVPLEAGRYRFHFPTTSGPRYVPASVPEEERARVTPPVALGPSAKSPDVDILVRLMPAAAFTDVVATSHTIETGVDAGGARLVALGEGDRVPNKDFVLHYRPAGVQPEAHVLAEREKGGDYLMLFVQPPSDVPQDVVRPREVVFLVDKSGSMYGQPLDIAKGLISRTLRTLGPQDTFELIAFDGAATHFAPGPLPNRPEHVEEAVRWLDSLEGGGGTEMLTGIRAAMRSAHDSQRLRILVFCTDGFIGNEDDIIDTIERTRGEMRVFGFGIGSSVNRYLIEGMAKAGRGASDIVDLRAPLEPTVSRLWERLDRPILTSLKLQFEGAAVEDPLPAELPDLFAGEPLAVVARARSGLPSHVVLSGKVGTRPYTRRIPILGQGGTAQEGSPEAGPVLGTLWARRRIEDLMAHERRSPSPETVEEVTALGLSWKLLTPYTSFVAVERELLVDVNLPLTKMLVPNLLPEGVSPERLFGPPSTAEVFPARVKPGDPELRIQTSPSARRVSVKLPFDVAAREAVKDRQSDTWVLRFLVPPAFPDGSHDVAVRIEHEGGRVEERTVPLRVDTTPAAVAVLSSPTAVAPGARFRLELKPALPASAFLEAVGKPGGAGNALKGAMEVKEVLVRAPWGEVVRAKLEGPLGVYVAELEVPRLQREGEVSLEIVASDAAGNVSRRSLALPVGAPATARASTLALAAFLLAVAAFAAWRRWRRPAPPPSPLGTPSGPDAGAGARRDDGAAPSTPGGAVVVSLASRRAGRAA